jgi:hypothetical protein
MGSMETLMEKPTFVPYKKAKEIVANVIEMEHPTEDGKRIFAVYNHAGMQICWFEADEVESEVDAEEFDEIKEHILHFIPDWVI